jgi:GntR family transcriptional regulator
MAKTTSASSNIPGGETVRPYQRLQIELAALINNTAPGVQLQSEPDLARSLGVSRATLRESMRSFEAQGLLRRRQGVGTFVVGHRQVIESGLEVLESIEALANKIHLDVAMGDLHVSAVLADQPLVDAMSIPLGTDLIRISRVMRTEQRPVAYLIDTLPADILTEGELNEGFTGSVLDFLLRRRDPLLEKSNTHIQAVAATSEVARALEIQRGDVLQMFVARLFTNTGRIVDYSFSYFLPGYFHFHVVRRVEKE